MNRFLELRCEMIRAGYNVSALAAACGMSTNSLSARLNGRTDWTIPEAQKVCQALGKTDEEIPRLFCNV